MAFSKASHVSEFGGFVLINNPPRLPSSTPAVGRPRSAGNASLRSKFALCNIARTSAVSASPCARWKRREIIRIAMIRPRPGVLVEACWRLVMTRKPSAGSWSNLRTYAFLLGDEG